ncbi:MAG: response regulator transcription factor [Gemmiger sp.]|nr:response regulator transcription factor [Gemmiger sp.]
MWQIQEAAILLVDDNPALLALLRENLAGAGYRNLTTAATCAEARAAFAAATPDFMVLDVNLPDGDGFSLFRELHAKADIPALFLSARDEDSDRLFGLGLGADDYLTKPFLTQELLLRIQLILRRAYRGKLQQTETATLNLGPCKVDLAAATVTGPGGVTPLTATERTLLHKLAENRGRIVTFDALCEAVWGDGYSGYENTLNVHIRHLREKVEPEPSKPRYLLTVRGLGYRLAASGEGAK